MIDYVGKTVIASAAITGYCALAGANDGFKWGLVALIFGGAAKD